MHVMRRSIRRAFYCLFESSKTYSKSDFKKCGNNVAIYYNSQIWEPENVELEDDIAIKESFYLVGEGGVLIKRGVMIGPNVSIYSCNHNYDSPDQTVFPYDERNSLKKVVIGEFSWIGRNVIILPGVTIGKGCVVGAGSIVTKDIEDFSIVAGVPARLIKKRDNQNINDSTISSVKGTEGPNDFRKFIVK
jgi:acetyltransferase-like isoleucine patch superfamily enzyme